MEMTKKHKPDLARPGPAYSALGTKLLHLWSAGEISAVKVQQLAHCAILDGAGHVELGTLAAAGNFGEVPGNVHRDISNAFLQSVSITEPLLVSTKAIDPKTSQLEEVQSPVFLPHILLADLQSYPGHLDSVMCTADLEEFWSGVEAAQDPKLSGHPMLDFTDWKTTSIPVFIHGDGVEYHERDSLMVYSFGSLLSQGASQDTSFLLAAFPKSATDKHETWQPLLEEMRWSFTVAFSGKHPATNSAGQPYPEGSEEAQKAGTPLTEGGFRLVVWSLQGDHDYFSNVLGLPHWRNDALCWACNTRTSDPNTTWQNLMPNQQGWTCKTVEEARNDVPNHEFFLIPGVSTANVAHDSLHVLFCKGVLSHLVGGALHTMCFPIKGRQTIQAENRLGFIFARVQELYRELGSHTRLTNLKLAMFVPDKHWQEHPFLKIKGGEMKHLLPCMAIIAAELCTGTEHDSRRAAALKSISDLVALFDKADAFLTSDEHALAMKLVVEFFGHYAWLNAWSAREDRLEYHIVPKFHMLHHLVWDSKYVNPRLQWCFAREDYVGKISTMAHSVSMGVRSTLISQKLSIKYRHLLHFRITRGDYHD
jgi:hypothetical protein